ncbi:ribonuclease J [Sphingomonas hengshuiensis]|uniref:RNA-metabolising metallo-beta-lactamase n=1 Tax=Sphingomonas hengshuiensis TaxID=1609977 RepID=A0A7U4J7U3_9SPHN|nr:ribonuclease J [Sphingomonas hengshuiensis]AJP71860.1 RNA-metabolising metallo-beta-lactamase [Sphingomonas hengshuiensis]
MTPAKELLFLALGGSGEIGMNVNLYGTQGKWLMVDCGITFGDSNYPGIDVILPDLQFIEDRLDDLLGIVLTHGHEDHIGALPYLAADLGVPLYATPFTAGLIRGKLEEEGNDDRITLNVVDEEGPFKIGPFTITYAPLAHSIPEGNALVIDTPYGRVFHTGDWKLDEAPSLGGASTAAELTAIGDKGVLALVCDSTNVFNPEASGSEADVRVGLDEVIGAATGRVLVTTFASNAARLQTLGDVARDTGRELCVAGRSLDRIIRVAKATGYLRDFPETVDFDTAMRLPPSRVLIVATGGQGEPRAALNRIAEGSHVLKVHEGDTVVFSSRQIPGNEIAIGKIMNTLADKGVILITDRQAFVHVSGHPGRPELAEMYKWIRPEIILPVHGEIRHMHEQARFALSQGVPQAITQVNGEIYRLAPGKPKKLGDATVGRLVLDGDVILPADGSTINERRKLALYGQLSVAVAVRNGKLAGRPQVRVQGVPVEEDREVFLEEAARAAAEAVAKDGKSIEKLRETLRLAVRRVATRYTGKKPVVDVLIVEV